MKKYFSAAVLMVSIVSEPTAFGQGFDNQIIAKTGDSAPGTSVVFGVGAPNAGFSGFALPLLNNLGHVTFLGQLTGSGVSASNDTGIWTNTGAGLELVARSGNSAPGITGTTLALFSAPVLSSQGHTAFFSNITGTGVNTSNNQAIFSRAPGGALQLVARQNNPATGIGTNINYGSMAFPIIRPDGSVVFASTLTGSAVNASNDSAMLFGTPGNVQVLARGGSIAPGTGSASFTQFSTALNTFTANASGTIAFQGSLVAGGSVTTANNTGIWGGTPGSINLVVRKGDIAPGIGNAIDNLFVSTVLANGSIVSLATTVTGGGVTTANNQALLMGTTPANQQLAFRSGDQVPNAGAGVVVGSFGNIASQGNTVVFRGSLAGTGITTGVNDLGIFTWSAANSLLLIAQKGNVAPGTGGALFNTLFPPDPFGGISYAAQVNSAGDVAFVSTLIGTGIDATNNVGLWYSRNGEMFLIARYGDAIDLDAGPGTDFATVNSISFLERRTNLAAGFSSLDDDGKVTWAARFTDGRTAVFLTAVPEPSTLIIIGAGILGAGLYWRRRSLLQISQTDVSCEEASQ